MDQHEALREKARTESAMHERLNWLEGNGIPRKKIAPAGASKSPESAIGTAMSSLEATLTGLADAVSVLAKRLDTALRSLTPETDGNQKRPEASVVLAEVLLQLNDQAREIFRRVNSITDRVELP